MASCPAASLYAPTKFVKENPNTVQALTNAIVRANKWLANASSTDVLKVVPEAFLLGDRALYLFAYDKVKDAFSKDGTISEAGSEGDAEGARRLQPEDQSRPRSTWARPTPTSS